MVVGSEVGAAATRVLIVDDNEDVADILSRLLRKSGFDTRIAFDAATALSVAALFAPEVALVDIGLPDVDGYELAPSLRALVGSSALYLVAMTGFALERDRARAKEVGFDEHLTKPLDVAEIRAVIAKR